jgi:DNA-binding response OmpR family regulator
MAEILVIDDDPQMGRLMARILKHQGHVVQAAASGREGLKLFRRAQPALVISDIVMPDGEGIETIRVLRREAPSMPILAVSGGSHQSLYLRAATSLGASASLQKPFAPADLVALVAEFLPPPSG